MSPGTSLCTISRIAARCSGPSHRTERRRVDDGRRPDPALRTRLETVDGVVHRLTVATEDHERDRSVRLSAPRARCPSPMRTTTISRSIVAASSRSTRSAPRLPLEREVRTFLDHLRGGPAPRSTLGDAVLVCEQVARLDALVRAGVTRG